MTMTQQEFFAAPVEPVYPVGASAEERFRAYHAANPQVYEHLARLARELTGRGRSRIGIGMLFEVIRWSHALTTVDPLSDFKLNNNARSRYARLLMEQEPDLAGVFEVRELRS